MKKVLFYAMQGEKMCFLHVLLNAQDLIREGYEVKIVLEGRAVSLPGMLVEEGNPLFRKARENGWIAGVCLACSKQLGSYEGNRALGLRMLDDMSGHAGMLPFIEEDYRVVVM